MNIMSNEADRPDFLSALPVMTSSLADSSTAGSIYLAGITATQFYYESAIVCIGTIGTLANGFVIYALYVSKQTTSAANMLMTNQLALDFYSCIVLTAEYTVKLCNVYLYGSDGYWLCLLLMSEMTLWCGINGSMSNLPFIAVERYLKICRPIWHKVRLRRWMLASVIFFSWANSAAVNVLATVFTTDVIDGQCVAMVLSSSQTAQTVFGVGFFLWYCTIPILLFIVCYERIFKVVRAQNAVCPSTSAGGGTGVTHVSWSAKDDRRKRMQSRVVRTAFTLTLFYAVSWLPNHLYFLLLNTLPLGFSQLTNAWYATLLLGFINISANPFIYGFQSDQVRGYVRHLASRINKLVQIQTVDFHPWQQPQSKQPTDRFAQSTF